MVWGKHDKKCALCFPWCRTPGKPPSLALSLSNSFHLCPQEAFRSASRNSSLERKIRRFLSLYLSWAILHVSVQQLRACCPSLDRCSEETSFLIFTTKGNTSTCCDLIPTCCWRRSDFSKKSQWGFFGYLSVTVSTLAGCATPFVIEDSYAVVSSPCFITTWIQHNGAYSCCLVVLVFSFVCRLTRELQTNLLTSLWRLFIEVYYTLFESFRQFIWKAASFGIIFVGFPVFFYDDE